MRETPDFAPPRDIRKDGTMTVSYGEEAGMIVEFYEEPLYMEYLSKTVGSPIYRMQIMTRLLQPGNNKTTWVHQTKGITYDMVVDPESGEYHTSWDVLEVCENGDAPEPTKYPQAWNRFLRKGVSADVGLPIEQWGAISRSYAESLKAQHIHTVEALSQLTDQAAQNIMGAVKYRDLARAHLDEKARTRIVAKEQERAARFEETCAMQSKQIQELTASVLALQAQLASNGQIAPIIPAAPNPQLGSQAANGAQLKQMSKAQAGKKHKIPGPETAAA